jgi:hypothetical protein
MDVGMYFRFIASIPAIIVIAVIIGIHYILQNLEANSKISSVKVESDIMNSIGSLASRDPLKIFLGFLWKSVKICIKNSIIAFLLLIPIGGILSIIQLIFTGNGNMTLTY